MVRNNYTSHLSSLQPVLSMFECRLQTALHYCAGLPAEASYQRSTAHIGWAPSTAISSSYATSSSYSKHKPDRTRCWEDCSWSLRSSWARGRMECAAYGALLRAAPPFQWEPSRRTRCSTICPHQQWRLRRRPTGRRVRVRSGRASPTRTARGTGSGTRTEMGPWGRTCCHPCAPAGSRPDTDCAEFCCRSSPLENTDLSATKGLFTYFRNDNQNHYLVNETVCKTRRSCDRILGHAVASYQPGSVHTARTSAVYYENNK